MHVLITAEYFTTENEHRRHEDKCKVNNHRCQIYSPHEYEGHCRWERFRSAVRLCNEVISILSSVCVEDIADIQNFLLVLKHHTHVIISRGIYYQSYKHIVSQNESDDTNITCIRPKSTNLTKNYLQFPLAHTHTHFQRALHFSSCHLRAARTWQTRHRFSHVNAEQRLISTPAHQHHTASIPQCTAS